MTFLKHKFHFCACLIRKIDIQKNPMFRPRLIGLLLALITLLAYLPVAHHSFRF